MVLIVGLAIFIATFDINQYKPRIIALVSEHTGRTFDIGGDLEFAYSLIPTVTVNQVRFGNADWGTQPDMARIDHFEATVALLPLLRGKVSISRLELANMDIYLETSKTGVGNWELQSPAGKKETKAPAPPATTPGPELKINEVLIQDSRVSYRDGVTGNITTARINQLDIAMGGLAQALSLKLSAAYNDIPLEMNGTLGSLASITRNEQLPLNLTGKVADVLLEISGTLGKPLQGQGLDADFKLEAPALDTLAKLSGKALPKTGPLRITGQVSEKDGSYALKNLDATAGKVNLKADGQVTPGPEMKMMMTIKLAAESLAHLDELAATQLPDLKPLALDATLANKDGGYQVSGLKLKLGNTDLAGDATVNLGGKRPALIASLTAGMVDLVPFTEKKPAAAKQAESSRVFPADPLPLEGLKSADVTLNLKASEVKSADYNLENVHLDMNLVDGKLALKPLSANTGGGALTLHLNVDASDSQAASLDTNIDIKGFEPSTLSDLKDEISGAKTDVTLTGKGSGASVAAIMAGLNGHLLVKMGPGILKSSKANAVASDVFVSTYQLIYPEAKSGKDTEIQCGVIRFDIQDGMATSDQGIAFATSKMNIIGTGTVDLKTETLDIGINPQAREGAGISAAQLAGLVRLGGTLAEPKAVPDAAGALRAAASVGAAVATGGVSLIAQGLFERKTADPDPCATALGIKPRAATPSSASQKSTAPTEKSGDAPKSTGTTITDKLKGLFPR